MTGPAVDVVLLEDLAKRAARGDDGAREELIEALRPTWLRIVQRSRSLGQLARSEEHVNQVLTLAIEKLGKQQGRALKLFLPWRERNTDKTFLDWLRLVTKSVIREYVREQVGSARPPR